jgi:hypothetical protein
MATPSSWISFQQQSLFETRVIRAVLGGTAAGIVHLVLAALGTVIPLPFPFVPFPAPQLGTPLPFFAAVLGGAALASWPGKGKALLMGALGIVGAIFLPEVLGVHPTWQLALAAAGIGALFLHAHTRLRDTAWSSQRPDSWARRGLAAAALSGLTVAGARVGLLLAVAAERAAAPALLVAALGGGVLGLFVGLATGVAHLSPPRDPVEAELEAALPKLHGELAEAAARALERYRQCASVLAALPGEPAREQLAETLVHTTRDVARLAEEWAGLEALLAEVKTEALDEQIQGLRARAATSTDLLARRQLEAAATALEESRARTTLLSDQRERIHAKLHAGVALLECARLALLGTRGGETQLKAAQLTALSERLKSLVAAQGEDARWVDALATGAELAATESRQQVS